MIFPLLRGFLPPHLIPMTWVLLALNVLVFFMTLPQYMTAQADLDRFFTDDEFMRTQGYVYAQFVEENPSGYSKFTKKMASRATEGDQVSQILMGGYSIRSRDFMEAATEHEFKGDTVALKKWKTDFTELREVQARHPNYKWGLSTSRPGWINWISYQFAHSGFHHLFWNMLSFILFATFLEVQAGGSFVILTYLGSGIAGAGLFSLLSGLTYSPLIGASGAVSGLMGCVTVLLWKQNARFLYWLLPMPGYFGVRELPAWLIGFCFLIPDVAGYLGSMTDVNGMAYTAHIGGTLFGGLVGFAIRQGWLETEVMPESVNLQ